MARNVSPTPSAIAKKIGSGCRGEKSRHRPFQHRKTPSADVLKGMNRVAVQNGYGLMTVEISEMLSDDRRLFSSYGYGFVADDNKLMLDKARQLDAVARRVDGFLVGARTPVAVLAYIESFDKPMVFFGSSPLARLSGAGSDAYRVTRLAGDFLVRQGHRHITYLGVLLSPWNDDRQQGLAHFLQE